MANFEEIATTHADKLADKDYKSYFNDVTTKLGELGFDILINDKKNAEFVPSGRLNDVVQQRDTFKGKVTDLNQQLELAKKSAEGNEELKANLQKMIDSNTVLMREMEETKVNTEILLEAKDAVDPKDVVLFINRDHIKVNAKGEVLGVKEEVARIRTEKPHLFSNKPLGKGGKDPSDNKGGDKLGTGGMNTMIRKASGRSF